jgi:hypothetical protein
MDRTVLFCLLTCTSLLILQQVQVIQGRSRFGQQRQQPCWGHCSADRGEQNKSHRHAAQEVPLLWKFQHCVW